MRIYSETYGCTMNQGDTELMLGKLENAGHKIVQDIEKSDIAIINTCAVKRTTLNKVLYRLKELQKEADQEVIVAGCLPLIDLEKIERIGEFGGIISCLTTDSIVDVVEKTAHGERGIKKIKGESEKPGGKRYRKSKVSAPVSIAEGCVYNCSYCCVKFARGRLRSFEPEEIVREVKNDLEAGRIEIYITAQDTAAYGLEKDTNLPNLLEKIASISGKFRVRVGMMHPGQAKRLMPELLDAYDDEKIYKFLHLPVQSGNNKVLQKMRRDYSVKDFKEIVSSFREKFPNLYLATDIIVGFPEESEEAFQDSCDLVREVKPDKVNLTRFTPMPKTDAKKMEQIKSEEKKRRSKKMTPIHHETSYEKNQDYIGWEAEGLVIKEGKKGGYVARLPNYKLVIVEEATPGEFEKIKVTGAEPTYLMGEVLER